MGEHTALRITRPIADALASEPYTRGRRAAHDGLTPGANPYIEGTADHTQWLQGLNSVQLDRITRELADVVRFCPPCQPFARRVADDVQ